MLTKLEGEVVAWMQTHTANGGFTARRIADYCGAFSNLSTRSKAGAMTALLRKLQAGGYVEKDRSKLPAIWRSKR